LECRRCGGKQKGRRWGSVPFKAERQGEQRRGGLYGRRCHVSGVGEGLVVAVRRQGPRPVGVSGGVAATPRWHVPAQIGEGRRLMCGPRYNLRRRGPLTCRPRPQCRGLNSPNGQIHLNLKFKLIQTLMDLKLTFPSPKILKLNMFLKTSKRRNPFSIETSYSERILNKNLEKTRFVLTLGN
jgi:hypothetical protein